MSVDPTIEDPGTYFYSSYFNTALDGLHSDQSDGLREYKKVRSRLSASGKAFSQDRNTGD